MFIIHWVAFKYRVNKAFAVYIFRQLLIRAQLLPHWLKTSKKQKTYTPFVLVVMSLFACTPLTPMSLCVTLDRRTNLSQNSFTSIFAARICNAVHTNDNAHTNDNVIKHALVLKLKKIYSNYLLSHYLKFSVRIFKLQPINLFQVLIASINVNKLRRFRNY